MYGTTKERAIITAEELTILRKASDLLELAYEEAETNSLEDAASDAYIALMKFVNCHTTIKRD